MKQIIEGKTYDTETAKFIAGNMCMYNNVLEMSCKDE